jgi:hypothetical protein
MISSIVESDTPSEMSKVLQKLEEYDAKFAKQEGVNEKLQRANEHLQKTVAGLSANVACVSYTSSFMTPA